MSRNYYRLDELDPSEFEKLCGKICTIILGEGFNHFSEGRDGGKDGKFTGKANSFPSTSEPYEGKFIIQAKHTTNPIGSCSMSEFRTILKKEIPKIQKLKENKELGYYILFTNRKLTAGKEAEFCEEIQKDIPDITFCICGKEWIHSFLDRYRDLHKEFGFDKYRSPLEVRPKELETVIKEFRKQIPKESSLDAKNSKKDFLYTGMEKKNEINNLSDDYYKYLREDSEKYFHHIYEFLKNPRNEEYKRLYTDTAFDFKGVIISRRDDYDKFDEIFGGYFFQSSFSIERKKC